MSITWADVITWLLVGLLAGPLAGMLVKGSKAGFGRLGNLGVGLVGALVGGVVFTWVPVLRPLAAISVDLEDVVAALVGCLLFLLALRFVRNR